MEMRVVFLSQMLKDCYYDLNWLTAIMNPSGEAALLVTNIFPQTPFLWAVLLSEAKYSTMVELFQSLEIETKQPFLPKSKVQRGTHCLGQCVLADDEEGSWNRCWVVDVVSSLAIVFFLDYGITANVPLNSLRQLDSEKFWKTPPLAQPFRLQEGCCSSSLVRTILKGKIKGSCSNERQILMFSQVTAEE
ncbi:tudor domain-containing protein 10 [Discoglossus pictus]